MKSKILAIIPARSGSKGIKDKNIKLIDNKPLIAYSIIEALKSNAFEDVFVSTDSERYAEISREYGAWVPFLRPKELAKDNSTTSDVIKDVLLKLKKIGREYDEFMILQPTSPLRDYNDILKAIQLFEEKKANCVVSMCKCVHSPLWTKAIDKSQCLDGFLSDINNLRRQDLPQYYMLNGAIYYMKVDYFLNHNYFYYKNSYAYIMDEIKSIDIDTLNDFEYAEFLIKKYKNYSEEQLV